MASTQSRGFHKFCRHHFPFLLSECPMGNLHFLWQRRCVCGVGEYIYGTPEEGDHLSDEYRLGFRGWVKQPKTA